MLINKSIAFIAGASRGIGRTLMAELLRRGAGKIYAAARNLDSL